jgi:hypothetical protein
MSLGAEARALVRRRAGFACEFCGVSEVNTGGQLTVDHFQPRSKGGGDGLDNLIYCCFRCNQHKADYWPETPDAPSLWNPRREPSTTHFLELEDGLLSALTLAGAFTLRRLHLNHPLLVANRRRQRWEAEARRLLRRYQEIVELMEGIRRQQASLAEEQQRLLAEQIKLLQLLSELQENADE